MNKRLLIIATAALFSGIGYLPVTHGATIEELQAQIDVLLTQITLLQAQLSSTSSSGTSETVPASLLSSNDLTIGSRKATVMDLQKYLGMKTVTGYFGHLTKTALAKWQAANGVSPATGYFGPKTRTKLSQLYTRNRLTPRGNIKVAVIEFKFIDEPRADWFYEFYCKSDDCIFRTPDQDTKYFINWCGANCKIDKKSFYDVFNNSEGITNIYSINNKTPRSYYSIYKLKEFYENEAKKYGVNLNISLDVKGLYILSSKPSQRLRDASPAALEKFFDEETKKHDIDITDYDIVNYLYFTSENYFVGTVSGKKTFTQALISFDSIFSSLMDVVHEMGHNLGAVDTYQPGTRTCKYPEGYPEPNKTPLYPQSQACLMCKSVMIDEKTNRAPINFSELVTCDKEAKMFGWK